MGPLYLLLLLATLTATSLAQDDSALAQLSLLPNCAQVCLVTAIVDSPCQLTNTTCICTNTSLQDVVGKCVISTCTVRESLTTKNATLTACHAPVRTQTTHLRIANLVLCFATSFCVIVRFVYQVWFSAAGLGWDDISVVVTILITMPSVVMIDRGLLHSGIGNDVWTVPFDRLEAFVKWLYTLTLLYFFQSAICKITLLLFFLRIFARQRTRQLIWATIAFITVWTLAFFIPASLPCLPLNDYWTAWDKSKPTKCLNIYAVVWMHAIICILIDVWMLSVPLFEVFHLQMTRLKKCGVASMFFVGTFVTVISMLRLKSLISFNGTENVTWDQMDVILWSVYEINVGMMCTCMPALRLAIVRVTQPLINIIGHRRGSRIEDEAGHWGASNGSGKRWGRRFGKGYGTELTGDTLLASTGTRKGSVNVVGGDKEGGADDDGAGIRCTKSFGIRREAEEDEGQLVPMDDLAGKMDRERERERERDGQSDISL